MVVLWQHFIIFFAPYGTNQSLLSAYLEMTLLHFEKVARWMQFGANGLADVLL